MQRLKENEAENALEAIEAGYIQSWNRMIKVFCSGLIVVNLLVFQGYLSLGSLDIAESISLYIFAGTLPLLILCTLLCILNNDTYPWSPYPLPRSRTSPHSNAKSELYSNVFLFASTINVLGIIAVFFHFSVILGVLFIFSIVTALLLLALSNENKEKRKRKQ